jgi:hypothetical protein
MNETITEQKVIKPFSTLILTPYLTENIIGKFDDDKMAWEMDIAKYNPLNLLTNNFLETQEGRKVLLNKPEWIGTSRKGLKAIPEIRSIVDLIIAGSTPQGESEVRSLKGFGVPIARYSMFYPECSEYTGDLPEETGYALDIPKSAEYARALLSNDRFVEAILERKASKVRIALDSLNKQLDTSIRATPYLEQVFN